MSEMVHGNEEAYGVALSTERSTFLMIEGSLRGGRQFTHPLMIQIDQSDGEFVVSETEFHIHAAGPTLSEAVAAFRRVFSGYLDVLSEEEHNLDDYMLAQHRFLQSYISKVQG